MFGRTMTCSSMLTAFLSVGILLASIPVSHSTEIVASGISGDSENPRRHARIRNTLSVEDSEAQRIYELIQGALELGYAASALPMTDNYQSFKKYNNSPYLSASHGNHYLNNYANEAAVSYGEFENSGPLPVGAILYKDSFSIEENQQIILGPLFVMEKMPAGFNSTSGDWKYTQINPTGDVLGITNGTDSNKVEYCIHCHITRGDTDQLFYIPESYRVIN